MGTNYYLQEREPCPCCERPFDRLHIGKSSGGWCFGLHVIPEEGLNTLDDWKARWAGKIITNEYDEHVTEAEMLSIITERSWDDAHRVAHRSPQWEKNFGRESYPGPNGLIRHGGRGVVGHGRGTWDLIEGEFS